MAYSGSEALAADNLNAAEGYPIITTGVTVASGQGELARGSILAQATAAIDATQAVGVDQWHAVIGAGAIFAGVALKASPTTHLNPGIDYNATASGIEGTVVVTAVLDGALDGETDPVVVLAIPAGTSGKLVLAGAGTNPVAILAQDIDATSADAVAPAHVAGAFQASACKVAEGSSVSDFKAPLRAAGIYLI